MAHLPTQLTRPLRRAAVCGLALALLAGTGCVGLNPFACGPCDPCKDAPTGVPCEVVTYWGSTVGWVPDPTHEGNLSPGLLGHMFLFGPTDSRGNPTGPFVVDGSAVVELFDDTPRPGGPNPVALEQWRIDSVTLKRLCKRGELGWGYTLFLPWGSYRPDIAAVHLKLRWEPAIKGMPLYAQAATMSLDHSNNPKPAFQQGLPGLPAQARTLQPPTPPGPATAAAVQR
jgi:hypothetical protein